MQFNEENIHYILNKDHSFLSTSFYLREPVLSGAAGSLVEAEWAPLSECCFLESSLEAHLVQENVIWFKCFFSQN